MPLPFSAASHHGLYWTLGLCALIGSIGCRPAAEIRSYNVPKEPPQAPAAATGPATDRMLAAILPADGQAWFFKVVGTNAQLDPLADGVEEFFASIKPGDQDQPPSWQLPTGWEQQPGSGMRLATLRIPAGESTLDMSVIRLPQRGDAQSSLLANVNRWRGQMQLAAVDAAGLAGCTRQLAVDETTLTVVDLVGRFASGGMGAGPVSRGQRTDARPPQQPPTSANAAPLKLTVPDTWQTLPVTGVRKAAYSIESGAQRAEVTVMDFPSGATSIADPLPNINRWRGQIGLAPMAADQLDTETEKLDVDGRTGTWVAFSTAEDADKPLGMVATMVESAGSVWFFKLVGDRELVSNETQNFRELVTSMRFSPAAPHEQDHQNSAHE